MDKKQKVEITVSVLFMQEGDYWVVQALEHDIVAQGKTMNRAKDAFEKTIGGQIYLDLNDNKKPLSDFPAAPKKYWDLFNSKKCEQLKEPQKFSLPKGILEGWIIEAQANDRRVCFAN